MSMDPKIEKGVKSAEKPDLTLAMELANYVHEELTKMQNSLTEQIRSTRNDNARTVKRIDELEGAFVNLKQDLVNRAVDRADKEVKEAAARYQIALEHKDGLSTQEKIQVNQLLEDRVAAEKKARVDRWRTFWDKITPNIATAMILAVLIPVWLAFVILVLAFVLRALSIQVQLP